MLAENIVHRAIDMERLRQAELRRQIDMVAKAALVNSVKVNLLNQILKRQSKVLLCLGISTTSRLLVISDVATE